MNEGTILLIWAHAEIQHTFDRHMPYWQTHGCPLLVVCPINSIVRTTWPVLAMERSTHHGPEINRKFRRTLQFAETTGYENFWFLEYDAVVLEKQLPQVHGCGIVGNRFTNHEPRFKGTHYFHPPIAFNRDGLHLINENWDMVDDADEFGFWDRHIGRLCDVAEINGGTWGVQGFSKNTIEQQDIPTAVAARKAGAICFHGVKSGAALKAIVEA